MRSSTFRITMGIHIKPISIFLAMLMFLGECFAASSAIAKDWDKILDKYERLCNECIELKAKAEAGVKISSGELTSLLNSLGSLRKQLSDGSGTMNAEQKERFATIRSKYNSAVSNNGKAGSVSENGSNESDATTIKDKPVTVGGKAAAAFHSTSGTTVKKTTDKTRQMIEAGPRAEFIKIPACQSRIPVAAVVSYLPAASIAKSFAPDADRHNPIETAKVQKSYSFPGMASHKIRYGISYCMGAVPDLSYGAGLSMSSRTGGWGGYLKFRSNFVTGATSYDCLSDGNTSGGSIWTSGNSRISLTIVSTGGRKVFGKYAGAYVGAGWGRYVTAWEDISGRWARVSDYSTEGALLECGLLFDFGPVELHAGVTSISFRYTDLEFGIGLVF